MICGFVVLIFFFCVDVFLIVCGCCYEIYCVCFCGVMCFVCVWVFFVEMFVLLNFIVNDLC